MSTVISSASLADLSKGNTQILAIPQVDVLTANTWTGANVNTFFTTKDSFSLKEGTPSETDIYLDQGNELLTTIVLSQKTVLKATLPSNAIEIFNFLYDSVSGSSAISGLSTLTVGGYTYNSHTAFSLTKKIVPCTLNVQSDSGQTSISIMHALLYGILNIENVSSKIWSFDIVANIKSFAAGDIIVHKQIATT